MAPKYFGREIIPLYQIINSSPPTPASNITAAEVVTTWKSLAFSNGAASKSDADFQRWLCQQVPKLDKKKVELTRRLLGKDLIWLRELSKLVKAADCSSAAAFSVSEREGEGVSDGGRRKAFIAGVAVALLAGFIWGSFKGLKWVWRRGRRLWWRRPGEDRRHLGGEDAEASGGGGTTQQFLHSTPSSNASARDPDFPSLCVPPSAMLKTTRSRTSRCASRRYEYRIHGGGRPRAREFQKLRKQRSRVRAPTNDLLDLEGFFAAQRSEPDCLRTLPQLNGWEKGEWFTD